MSAATISDLDDVFPGVGTNDDVNEPAFCMKDCDCERCTHEGGNVVCDGCAGSGDGFCDGAKCSSCGGSGVLCADDSDEDHDAAHFPGHEND